MIRVFIFSYVRDQDILPWCIACVRSALPEAVVTVIDDSAAPCNSTVPGVAWRTSAFNRNANLRGRACIEGMIKEMIRNAADDDICIKIDCDTAMMTAEPIRRMIAAGADGLGSSSPIQPFHGCLYAFKASALRKMLSSIDRIPLDDDSPEDISMHDQAQAVGLNILIEPCWLPERPTAKWTAYNWPIMPDISKYQHFDVVTLGNDRIKVSDQEVISCFQALHSFQSGRP